ncbi:MAG: DUF502 domain-containing protein [Parvularculales bacterium]
MTKQSLSMPPEASEGKSSSGRGFFSRVRRWFLTGVVVAAPVFITIYITIWVIELVDDAVDRMIPVAYHPEQFLQFSVPGLGVVIALVLLTLLGALTANIFGRGLIRYGESLVGRMPIVRTVYNASKQILETVINQRGDSFSSVGLIEYPRKDLYALVFVTSETTGEVQEKTGQKMVSVFLPTTPNPTSGYLLFVPTQDIMILDMNVEEAAKMVVSAGLVTPGMTEEDVQKILPPKAS